MAFAFAGNHLIAYYILAGIVQVGVATMSSIGVPTLINAWLRLIKELQGDLHFRWWIR